MTVTAEILSDEQDSLAECLSLDNFGIAYANHVVISDISLHLPSRGIVVLVGPTGTGKSTLLRTLAGFNEHIPSLRTWGKATYCAKPLSDLNCPVLLSQNTRLLTSSLLENLLYCAPERFSASPDDKRARALVNLRNVGLDTYEGSLATPIVELPLVVQRLVAIARAVATNPKMILIDEPTFGLEELDAGAILRVIQRQSEHRAMLVVLHNQRQARYLGGTTALLSGGVIQETAATKLFFAAPQTVAGREYVDFGTCSDPSPAARAEDLDTNIRPRLRLPPTNANVPSESLGPRGFVWLLPGQLAGTPQPGVVADVDRDLAALERVGINVLISLTSKPLDPEVQLAHGISAHWFPIPDMGAPNLSTAKEICRTVDRLLNQKAVIAVHCRAGHGRTGTILVAYLIWRGQTAMDALETARRFEPKWVQSKTQIRFLEKFATDIQPALAEASQAALITA